MSRNERIEIAAEELMMTVEEVEALVERAKGEGRKITAADAIAEGALQKENALEESNRSSEARHRIGWA